MFASKSTRGFYDPTIHTTMPEDAVEMPEGLHAELLTGQSEGKIIAWVDDGCPVLVDPPLPSQEVLAANERVWRDGQLAATDGVVSRHRDEVEEVQETTLTPTQYSELQAYRRELRDWPQAGDFPQFDHRPAPPPWLVEQLQ
ncbi:phage tail protein [Pseudomonas putida]|nr:phage tail protein [Pseudomonas putida]